MEPKLGDVHDEYRKSDSSNTSVTNNSDKGLFYWNLIHSDKKKQNITVIKVQEHLFRKHVKFKTIIYIMQLPLQPHDVHRDWCKKEKKKCFFLWWSSEAGETRRSPSLLPQPTGSVCTLASVPRCFCEPPCCCTSQFPSWYLSGRSAPDKGE